MVQVSSNKWGKFPGRVVGLHSYWVLGAGWEETAMVGVDGKVAEERDQATLTQFGYAIGVILVMGDNRTLVNGITDTQEGQGLVVSHR